MILSTSTVLGSAHIPWRYLRPQPAWRFHAGAGEAAVLGKTGRGQRTGPGYSFPFSCNDRLQPPDAAPSDVACENSMW